MGLRTDQMEPTTPYSRLGDSRTTTEEHTSRRNLVLEQVLCMFTIEVLRVWFPHGITIRQANLLVLGLTVEP